MIAGVSVYCVALLPTTWPAKVSHGSQPAQLFLQAPSHLSPSAQLTAVAASPLCLASEAPQQLFPLLCTNDRYQNPLSALPMNSSNVLTTLLC